MFSLPRLQPPPPLCDCLKPPTRLERLIWWLSRRCRKKHRVVFDRVVVPNIRKGWQDTPDLRDILSSDSLKSNTGGERCANSAYAPTLCSVCGEPHRLTELDAGSDQEFLRLCDRCFRKQNAESEVSE